MSERTFARRFAAETGATPHKWLAQQRILAARSLLEESDLSVEQIASRVGFNSAVVLREHFRRTVGVSPSDYRRRFGMAEDHRLTEWLRSAHSVPQTGRDPDQPWRLGQLADLLPPALDDQPAEDPGAEGRDHPAMRSPHRLGDHGPRHLDPRGVLIIKHPLVGGISGSWPRPRGAEIRVTAGLGYGM